MYSATNEPVNQNVNINFTGDDKLTNVVTSLTTKISDLQLKVFASNLALGAFNKSTNLNITGLGTLTKTISSLDKTLQSSIGIQTFAKITAQAADGILKANKQLQNFELGLKTMEASGYSTQILDDFQELSSIITLNNQGLERFSLNAITAYNRFAKAKSEVEVLFNPGDEFVQNLSTNIQKLVNDDLKNAVTSIDALAASYQAASAGFTKASENQDVMIAGLKLAKAGGAAASDVLKVLTQTIRAYGLQSSDADKVAAALNKTVQLGITTMPELAQGFAQTAVVAKEAGIKLEELSGAVAALTLKGSSTPSALTGIESLSRVIINKTPQAVNALRDLTDEAGKAIKFDIAEIKTLGLAKALDRLNKAAQGNAQVLAEVIPESLAYSTALGLMADNAKQLTDNTEQIKNIISTGASAKKALDEVFGIKLNNQGEKFEQIVNRITEQFIQFGEQLAPFFEVGVNAIESFSKVLASISPEMKALIAQAIIAQLTFSNLFNVVGTLASTVVGIAGTFLGWRAIMLLFNGQLGKTVEVISGLIKTNAGLIPVIKQIIGLDQSRLLLEKETLESSKSKLKILNELRTGENGRLKSLQELVGWDKEYIITANKANSNLELKNKLLKSEVESNRTVIKSKKELENIEKQANEEKEKGMKLFKDLESKLERQLELEKEIVQNKDSFKVAKENNDGSKVYESQKNLLNLEKEKILLNKEIVDSQNAINSQTTKYTESLAKVSEQEAKTNEVRKRVGTEINKLNLQKLKAKDLEVEAIELQNKSANYADRAEKLRSAAKNNAAKSAELLEKAEKAEAISKAFNNKAIEANTKVTAVNAAIKTQARAASLAEAVANKSLVEVNTLLGKSYIFNNGILKILFTSLNTDLSATFAGAAAKTVGFTGIVSASFVGMGTIVTSVLTAVNTQLTALYTFLAPFLPVILPIVAGLAAIGGVLYDQFAGTGKEIREMNNALEESEKQLNNNLIKTLLNSEATATLSKSERLRLHNLQMQSIEYEKQESILDSIIGNTLGGLGNIWKAITFLPNLLRNIVGQISDYFEGVLVRIPVIGEYLSAILDSLTGGLAKIWDTFNLDRVQGTIGKLQKRIEQAQEENINLIKSNKELLKGFTGDPTIDAKLRKGEALSVEMQQRAKAVFERNVKQTEEQIKSNDEILKNLSKQLEGYDKLSAKDQENASSADKAIAAKRDTLEAQNEKLKSGLEKQKETNKVLESVQKDTNQMLKTISENNLEIGKGSTTKLEDIGVNAVETRLKKSLRQSEEDLDQYAQFVIAKTDGTSRVIVNGVERDLNIVDDIGENQNQKYKEKIDKAITDINALVENGSLKAEEGAEKINKILNKQRVGINGYVQDIKSILDNADYLQYLDLEQKMFKKASDNKIATMSDEITFYKEMQESKVTTLEYGNKKIRELESRQLDEQIKSVQKQKELAEATGGKEALESSIRQLNILNQKRLQLTTRNAIEEKNYLLNVEKQKNDDLLQLNQIYSSAKIGNQEQLNKLIGDLEIKQIQNTKQQLINQLEEYKKIPGIRKEELLKIERQLTIISAQEAVKRIEVQSKEIDARYKKQQNNLDKETTLIKLQREQRITSSDDAIKLLENEQKQSIILKQKEIKERIALAKRNNSDTIELEKQLLELQLSYQQVITQSSEREYQKRIKLINLSTEELNLNNQKILNTLDSTTKSLQEEQKILDSRNSLFKSQLDYEEAKLGLQIKSLDINTNYNKSIEERTKTEEENIKIKSKLELEAIELRQKTLVQEQRLEQESFLMQQKTIDLALQRQQIELNIKKIQLDSSNKILELELEKAIKDKVAETEVKTIELKLAANKEEAKVLSSSQNLINISKKNQEEITANTKKQLDNKQELAKNGGLLDIEIKKEQNKKQLYELEEQQRNRILDKRIASLQVESTLEQLNSDMKIKSLDFINRQEERRLDLFNKQIQAEENTQSNIQKQFSLAIDLTENERKKAKLAQAAAAQELNSLHKKQELEEKLLEMQLRQNRAALERSKIEQEVAKLRLEAELKIEQANAQKTLADKNKTKEEKDAAIAGIKAKEFALKAQQYEDFFLKQKEQDLGLDENIQRSNLQEKQRNDKLDKTIAYARTTKSKRDEKALLRELNNALSPYQNQNAYVDPRLVYANNANPLNDFNNTVAIPSFKDFLNEKEITKPTIQTKQPDYNNAFANNIVPTKNEIQEKEKQRVVINFTNTNEITVNSDNPTKELGEKLQETTIKTMYDIFRKVNIDLGNN